MVTTANLTNQLLEDAATVIYDNYKYLGCGTGTQNIADGATQLSAGVSVQLSSFNKLRETNSYINGRNIVMMFNLEPGEPYVQPINLGEVGLLKTINNTGGLGLGAKLNVVQVKDNTVKQRWRVSASIIRNSEV